MENKLFHIQTVKYHTAIKASKPKLHVNVDEYHKQNSAKRGGCEGPHIVEVSK